MKSLSKKIWLDILFWAKNNKAVLKNKATVVTIFFVFWMTFIDQHNLIERIKLNAQTNRLEKQKAELIEGIEQAKLDKKDLEENKEKFAREKYYMHKENEEVFIIEKKVRY